MSEFMNIRSGGGQIRWRLMIGGSTVALLAAASASPARAEDTGRPTVRIDVGVQLERVDGGLERFAPPFVSQIDVSRFTSPIAVQRPPRYANGLDGSLSLQPEDSDWIFSAAIRYGRSNSNKKVHQESPAQILHKYYSVPLLGAYGTGTATAVGKRYANTDSRYEESHMVLDFQVGKDVGLGLFGRDSTSTFGAGIRFAQFASKTASVIGGDPDFHVSYKYADALPPPLPPIPGYFKIPLQYWHLYRASAEIARSFHGIGPSISWNSSVPVAGNAEHMELTFDWGVNAAVLFGRQKVVAHHETDGSFHYPGTGLQISTVALPHHAYATARSRMVTIPNVGGLVGLSVKFPNAKVSLGYRGDFFFGAMDGGIDVRKTYDRNFYGPYATISIGL
ncbi:MAG TPA: hypothetical protein VHD95_00975 [Rhizomicrobium sp.]|nr:hypothetical protein [Rhizomicrobium sp.]